jgi:hypothetical protein
MPAQISGKTYSNGQLILGGGLILALINWFIGWWWVSSESSTGYSVGGVTVGSTNISAGISGLGYWEGDIGFVVLLVLIVYLAVRMFAPQVIPALPVQDSMIFAGGGVFMLLMVVLLLTYGGGTSASGLGYSYSNGISIGFFVGLITTAAVAVGGWLTKSEAQPATAPMNFSGFNQAPPPPPPAGL